MSAAEVHGQLQALLQQLTPAERLASLNALLAALPLPHIHYSLSNLTAALQPHTPRLTALIQAANDVEHLKHMRTQLTDHFGDTTRKLLQLLPLLRPENTEALQQHVQLIGTCLMQATITGWQATGDNSHMLSCRELLIVALQHPAFDEASRTKVSAMLQSLLTLLPAAEAQSSQLPSFLSAVHASAISSALSAAPVSIGWERAAPLVTTGQTAGDDAAAAAAAALASSKATTGAPIPPPRGPGSRPSFSAGNHSNSSAESSGSQVQSALAPSASAPGPGSHQQPSSPMSGPYVPQQHQQQPHHHAATSLLHSQDAAAQQRHSHPSGMLGSGAAAVQYPVQYPGSPFGSDRLPPGLGLPNNTMPMTPTAPVGSKLSAWTHVHHPPPASTATSGLLPADLASSKTVATGHRSSLPENTRPTSSDAADLSGDPAQRGSSGRPPLLPRRTAPTLPGDAVSPQHQQHADNVEAAESTAMAAVGAVFYRHGDDEEDDDADELSASQQQNNSAGLEKMPHNSREGTVTLLPATSAGTQRPQLTAAQVVRGAGVNNHAHINGNSNNAKSSHLGTPRAGGSDKGQRPASLGSQPSGLAGMSSHTAARSPTAPERPPPPTRTPGGSGSGSAGAPLTSPPPALSSPAGTSTSTAHDQAGNATNGGEDDLANNKVHSWLKSLRLHKYYKIFEGLSYEQMIELKDEDLLRLGVSATGARTKMLKSIEALRERNASRLPHLHSMIQDMQSGRVDVVLNSMYETLQLPLPADASDNAEAAAAYMEAFKLAHSLLVVPTLTKTQPPRVMEIQALVAILDVAAQHLLFSTEDRRQVQMWRSDAEKILRSHFPPGNVPERWSLPPDLGRSSGSTMVGTNNSPMSAAALQQAKQKRRQGFEARKSAHSSTGADITVPLTRLDEAGGLQQHHHAHPTAPTNGMAPRRPLSTDGLDYGLGASIPSMYAGYGGSALYTVPHPMYQNFHSGYTSAPMSPRNSLTAGMGFMDPVWGAANVAGRVQSPSQGGADVFSSNPQARAPGHERASARSSLSFEGSKEDLRLQGLSQLSPTQGHVSPMDIQQQSQQQLQQQLHQQQSPQ